MKNKLVRYLIIMFISFVIDSILRFYLPSSILKLNLTIVPYVGVMMFDLLTNTIDEDHRYIFAGICGIYFSVIYGNSIFVYVLLFFMYSFFEKRYMKKAVMIYFEANCHRCFDNFCTGKCVIFFNVDNKYNSISDNNISN